MPLFELHAQAFRCSCFEEETEPPCFGLVWINLPSFLGSEIVYFNASPASMRQNLCLKVTHVLNERIYAVLSEGNLGLRWKFPIQQFGSINSPYT